MAKVNQIHPDAKKNYNCNQCGYSCNKHSMLKRHILVHSGKKTFVCSQCKYSSTRADTLRVHMRTHSGEKPYHCEQCDFSCTTISYLNAHILIHSGEKRFHCTQCTSSFIQRSRLIRHISTHSTIGYAMKIKKKKMFKSKHLVFAHFSTKIGDFFGIDGKIPMFCHKYFLK